MAREGDQENLLMLICSRCGSQHIVWDREYSPETGVTYRPRCFKCNRDKFEEVVKVELTNHEEPTMGTYGKKCEAPGCEKRSWLKGLCHKHYIEKHGEYVPQSTRPYKKKVAEKQVAATKEAAVCIETPHVIVYMPEDIKRALEERADKEFRTPQNQVLWFVVRGLGMEAGI